MNSNQTMKVVRAIYHEVHLALWATLIAFAICFAAFVLPKLPEIRANAERFQHQQIAAENETYCKRWHMGAGTVMHRECMWDLQHLRAKIADRLAEESNF